MGLENKIGEREQLSALLDGDIEDAEVLGYMAMYSVGEVLVERDWLLVECEDLDIPEELIPRRPTWNMSYRRAINRMFSNMGDRYQEVMGYTVQLEFIKPKGEGRGPSRHLRASVFYPEDEVDVEGGDWEHHTLGYLSFDNSTNGIVTRKNPTPGVDIEYNEGMSMDTTCPKTLVPVWENAVAEVRGEMARMRDIQTDSDIRGMFSRFRNGDPKIVSLRDSGAVYFVPANSENMKTLKALEQLYKRINKQHDERTVELYTVELIDSSERREWVRTRVEEVLNKIVDEAIEETFTVYDANEETAEAIMNEIKGRLKTAEDTAEAYNGLLETQMRVEEVLSRRAEAVQSNKQRKIIEQALDDVSQSE